MILNLGNVFPLFRNYLPSEKRGPSFEQSPKFLLDIPTNIQEIALSKFIVKLWTLPDTSLDLCSVCGKPFSNAFEHITSTCPETSIFRNAFLLAPN